MRSAGGREIDSYRLICLHLEFCCYKWGEIDFAFAEWKNNRGDTYIVTNKRAQRWRQEQRSVPQQLVIRTRDRNRCARRRLSAYGDHILTYRRASHAKTIARTTNQICFVLSG